MTENSIYRNGRVFGNGMLVGDHADRNYFFNLTDKQKAHELGWSHGCPIPQELCDPANKYYGPEKMIKRYGSVNFWFNYLLEQIAAKNPTLFLQLSRWQKRKNDEPVGYFEPQSVPDVHKTDISPMTRIYGYAIPRVLIEIIGRGDQASAKKMVAALNFLDESLSEISTPQQLLAILAEYAVMQSVSPESALTHILPSGVLEEDNCRADYSDILEALYIYSPIILYHYSHMTAHDYGSYGIANPADFN